MGANIRWSPRAGHVVAVEPALSENNDHDRMTIHGGYNENGMVVDQTWSWGAVCESMLRVGQTNGFNADGQCDRKQMAHEWVEDYTPKAWYRFKTKIGSTSCLIFSSGIPPDKCWVSADPETTTGLSFENTRGPPTPQQFYVDEHTSLARLDRVYLPGTFYSGSGKIDTTLDARIWPATRVKMNNPWMARARIRVESMTPLPRRSACTGGQAGGGQCCLLRSSISCCP